MVDNAVTQLMIVVFGVLLVKNAIRVLWLETCTAEYMARIEAVI